MTCYIKYCGGCNETFSRSAAAEKIKREFKDKIDFVYHDPTIACDIGVLIEGCGACCVVRNELAPCKQLIEICSLNDIGYAISEIKIFLFNTH